jgi:hypothetical protein
MEQAGWSGRVLHQTQFSSGVSMLLTCLRATAAAAALAVPVVAIAAPAEAYGGGCGDGMISVHVSDRTPASGVQFTASGQLTISGVPAADHVVRFQTMRDGAWVPIAGAHMRTDSQGNYTMRLILSQTGKRTLRAVGVGQGDEMSERHRFTVTVH